MAAGREGEAKPAGNGARMIPEPADVQDTVPGLSDDATLLLAMLFPERTYIDLRAFKKGEPDHVRLVDLTWPDGYAAVGRFAHENADRDVYFGVAGRDGKGRTADHLHYLGAFWVDVDYKLTPETEVRRRLEALDAAAITPTLKIHSGGGLHLYWAIEPIMADTEADRIEVNRALKALTTVVAGDPRSAEAAHIMRLPGTYNRKPDYPEPRLVQLVGIGWNEQGITRDRVAYPPMPFMKLAIMAAEEIFGARPAAENKGPATPRADREQLIARALQQPGAVRRDAYVKFQCPACADNRFDDSPSGPHDKHHDNAGLEIATGIWGCAWDKSEERLHNKAIGEALGVDLPVKLRIADFWMHAPSYQFIFVKTGDLWPASSVNARIRARPTGDVDRTGKKKSEPASSLIARTRCVEQITWFPGEPQLIKDRLLRDGLWMEQPGAHVFNLYRAPAPPLGDKSQAGPWLGLLARLWPQDYPHLIAWFAHRVQRPGQKVNHALVLGGPQGIGKDSALEPVVEAVGHWNVANIRPLDTLSAFNPFVKSVILRISEVRDLGEMDRRAFYEHMKVYIAAPPDVHQCNEKHLRQYAVPNVCGCVLTTNYVDALYLAPDDRRHFVAWSDADAAEWSKEDWTAYYDWLAREGNGHIAAYLAAYDLSKFDPKAPPPHTKGFNMMLGMSRSGEDDDMAEAIEQLGEPDILTIEDVVRVATHELQEALTGQGRQSATARAIPKRMEKAGYRRVLSDAKSGKWSVYIKEGDNRRQLKLTLYAKKKLNEREVAEAAKKYLDALAAGPRYRSIF
jgi:hypothetical protein